MDRAERLKRYLKLIMRADGLEAVAPVSAEEAVAAAAPVAVARDATESGFVADAAASAETMAAAANRAIEKLLRDEDAGNLTPAEIAATEAIIFPRERPAVDIVDGDFRVDHPQWLDLNEGAIHARLARSIPAIGRIGLPGQRRIPYAGTGFIVGDGLLMTNRHVAEIFASGVGDRSLTFRSGWAADVDFRRERDRPEQEVLRVRGIRLIHPYWDMALLEVEGLAAGRGSLALSLMDVAQLDDRRVAVIGYPAYDPVRNDVAVQDQVFSGTYGVKRLQPGRLHPRRDTESFKKIVSAGTHDCSTLGGNSGSAVIDLETGEVVGLHFGGRYADINYCVPAFELARDGRVADAGVKFAGRPVGGIPPWNSQWAALEAAATDDGASPPPPAVPAALPPPAAAPPPPTTGAISFTVPLTISIHLGAPAALTVDPRGIAADESVTAIEEALVEVWHDTDYRARSGYRADFLPGAVVPMPRALDASVVAPLLDGGDTLHYGHFSLQMHARRRLALFTGANVTADRALKKPEPGFAYGRKALGGLGPRDQEKWFPDPRLAANFQLDDRFYTEDNEAFDKGHIVRRDDVAWGQSYAELRQANGDTFHITNCSPQVMQFNQSQRGRDNWGDLENLVLGQAASERYCVFAGPILDAADETFLGRGPGGGVLRLQIPRAYWKIVVAKTAAGIASYAFVLDQDLSGVDLEFTIPDAFRQRMTPIAEIEQRTGLVFPPIVQQSDQFDDDRGLELAFRAGIKRVTRIDAG